MHNARGSYKFPTSLLANLLFAGRAWDMLLGIQSLYFYTAGS